MLQLFTRHDSLALRVMLAALLAIALVLVLAFDYEISEDTDDVRARGINLARLVTELSHDEQLTVRWEHIFTYQLSDPSFAYATIIGPTGTTLVEVAASGVIVPPATLPESQSWLQQTKRTLADRDVIEHFGVVPIAAGTGHFRVAYFEPTIAVTLNNLPFIAALILPVFLMAPLFLLLFRREINPLKSVNTQLSEVALADAAPVPANSTNDLRGFAEQFNHFIEIAKDRIQEYQDEKSKLVTSEKFLGYRLHRSESVLNSMPYAVLVLDQDATVSFANSMVKPLLDCEPEHLVGEKIFTAIPCEAITQHFGDNYQRLGALVGEPFTFNPQHRPEVSLRATTLQLQQDDGHYLVVFSDISQEVRAQDSRSEFVAHLAHELKAPLHTLSMYSEALQDDVDSEEFRLEATNVIGDEVERLARLINNLLSMTQIEMGTMQMDQQRIRLVDLVRDATEAMERSARGRELTFEMDLPQEVTPVLVDKDLLRIAINNLLTNAIKYTDAGGTVSVSVSENDDAVTICVADTGIGIAAADQAQIFHKFYRAENEEMEGRTGHGLGLPLARDIVEMHHGSIRVESQLGYGSRFYIELWKQAGITQQAI